MSDLIHPKNYFPLPNAVYYCALSLYRDVEIVDVELDKLYLSQKCVNKKKCEILKDVPEIRDDAGLATKIENMYFVTDGHHRAVAAHLRGDTTLKLRLIDLDKYFTENVERHKGKDYIDLYDISASDLEEVGLL